MNGQDNALRQALQRDGQEAHLSPNFSFRTMQRVAERARLRRRQSERRLLTAIVAASVVLAGGGAWALIRMCGPELRRAFALMWPAEGWQMNEPLLSIAGPCLLISALLALDFGLRRAYFRRVVKRRKKGL